MPRPSHRPDVLGEIRIRVREHQTPSEDGGGNLMRRGRASRSKCTSSPRRAYHKNYEYGHTIHIPRMIGMPVDIIKMESNAGDEMREYVRKLQGGQYRHDVAVSCGCEMGGLLVSMHCYSVFDNIPFVLELDILNVHAVWFASNWMG